MSKRDREKEKSRRLRRLAKQKQDLAELAQREDVEGEEETPIAEDIEVVEKGQASSSPTDAPAVEMEKYYDYPAESMYMGPTSFDELDEMRMAQEKADEVREVTWDVQDLVRNILHSPMLEPGEKASKIQQVASGFEARVSEVMAEDLEKDMDVLQIEAILAAEERSRSFLQKTGELIKSTLTGAARKKLSAGDFALPEKKKYPIHDKAHVRNALARAAQQIKAGGEGAEDARKALPKIRAAAKKMGIESMEKSAIMIEKDAKGDWRWIGMPTNNFIDWQTDIISKSAHEKYAAFLDENPEMAPVFMSWHTPGTERENPVDFWMEQDGALIMSGILTENEAASLLRMQKQVDLGMSFLGDGLRLSPDKRVVTDYWMFEVSDLPRENAANPFTMLETMIKEVGMDKLKYLAGIMGSEEKAKAFLEKTGQMQKELQAAGITSKEKDEGGKVKDESPEPKPQIPESTGTPADVTALIAQITKAMRDEFDIDGLNAFVAQAQEDHEKLETLEPLVQELSKSQEDVLAEALTPPASKLAWARNNRPSQSASTKMKKGKDEDEDDEDEKLSKSQPGVPDDYWLSQVTNTSPIPIES